MAGSYVIKVKEPGVGWRYVSFDVASTSLLPASARARASRYTSKSRAEGFASDFRAKGYQAQVVRYVRPTTRKAATKRKAPKRKTAKRKTATKRKAQGRAFYVIKSYVPKAQRWLGHAPYTVYYGGKDRGAFYGSSRWVSIGGAKRFGSRAAAQKVLRTLGPSQAYAQLTVNLRRDKK